MSVYSYQECANFLSWKSKEKIPDGMSMNFGFDRSDASIDMIVDSVDFPLAIQSILGTSYVNEDGLLVRHPPMAHPRCLGLVASSIRIKPLSGAIKKASDASPLKIPSGVALNFMTDANFANGEDFVYSSFYMANYPAFEFNISFSELAGITFAGNNNSQYAASFFNKEYNRYCSYTFEPAFESIQSDGMGNLVFDAGPAINQAFPTPVGIPLPAAKLTIKWRQVPQNFISTLPKIPSCPRILHGIGKVNKDPFLGFSAGQLLLQGVKFDPKQIITPDRETNCLKLKLGWDISFEFKVIMTVAAAWPEGNPEGHRFWGHNIFPCRVDRKFYPASVREANQPVASGPPLYQAYNFESMFVSKNT